MSDRTKKSNYITQSGIRGVTAWAVLSMFLVKMIYMSYQCGMNAMTFYAYAEVVFVMGYVLFGTAIIPVLKKMVYFQINHGNYRNTMKLYRVIEMLLFLIAVICAAVLFFFSDAISVFLFREKLCSLLFKYIAGALFFWIMTAGLKGYMEGIGNPMPGIFADVIAHLISLLVTVLSQPAFSTQGRKVAALMRQDTYAYAYAACSGALGLLIGSLAGFTFLIFVRYIFGKEIRKRARMEESRKTDSAQDILWNFFGNYLKNAFVENIGVILGVVLFGVYAHFKGKTADGAGVLYIGMVLPAMITALLATQLANPFARQLSSIMKQSDYHHAKERMSFYLKMLSYTIIPVLSVGYAVAPLLARVFFDVEQQNAAVVLRIGMISAGLVAYGVFLRKALSVVAKPHIRHICALLLGVSGIVFLSVLKIGGMTGEKCAAYAYVLACLFYMLLTAFFILKKIRIYNRLLDSFVIPAVASVLVAAVVFGIFVVLNGKISDMILLILCIIPAYFIYQAIICFLHIFEAHEWREVPAAGLPVAIAKLFGKY